VITLRKLATLSEGTRLRKIARLLDYHSLLLYENKEIDDSYIYSLVEMIQSTKNQSLSKETHTLCAYILLPSELTYRLIGDLSLSLHADLALERADWDMYERGKERQNVEKQPFTMVLDRLRSPFNVGSLFRTADSFGVERALVITPGALPTHRRAIRTARGTSDRIAYEVVSEQEALHLLHDAPVFALELEGTPIQQFDFPLEGSVVVGSEELGVSPPLLQVADNSLGRVSIPLFGSKGSLNVSVAFGILMHMWHLRVTKEDDPR
jgi:TrmH family RNA methyltransferase